MNQIGVNKEHKVIRKWDTTDAYEHESQNVNDLLDLSKHRQRCVDGQCLPLDADRDGPEGEGLHDNKQRRATRNCLLSGSFWHERCKRSLRQARICRKRIRL